MKTGPAKSGADARIRHSGGSRNPEVEGQEGPGLLPRPHPLDSGFRRNDGCAEGARTVECRDPVTAAG